MAEPVFDSEDELRQWLEAQQKGYGTLYARQLFQQDFRSVGKIASFSAAELEALGLSKPAAANLRRRAIRGAQTGRNASPAAALLAQKHKVSNTERLPSFCCISPKLTLLRRPFSLARAAAFALLQWSGFACSTAPELHILLSEGA